MSAKKIGKVQSKRSKKTTPQKRSSNKVLYFGVVFTVLSLVLFICAHFLQIIFGDTRQYWMGIEVSNLITDITLYLAIGLLFVMLILWISFHISKEGVLKR